MKDSCLYCASWPAWQHCKMGMWRGHYKDLWQRYATTLGSEMTTVIVFQYQGRQALESILFGYIRKLYVCGEVYERDAISLFLEFGDTMCEDKCNVPSDIQEKRQEEARRVLEKKHIRERRGADKMLHRRACQDRVVTLIRHCCELHEEFAV